MNQSSSIARWVNSTSAVLCSYCKENWPPGSYVSWNYQHGYAEGCLECKTAPLEIVKAAAKNELKKVKSAFDTSTQTPAPSPRPRGLLRDSPNPDVTSEPQSKLATATSHKNSKTAAYVAPALNSPEPTDKIENDNNGETTMATPTTTNTSVQTLVSITSDRNASFFTNVMNAASAGAELGSAGAASGSATDFVIKRVSKTWPTAGMFISATPLVRPALDFAVPVGVGLVTWNKLVPGVSAERQEKIANWCLVAISSHVDTIMSKVGRDFFSSLFKHMENAVEEWNANPLGG